MILGKIYRRIERLVLGRKTYKFLIKDWAALGDLQRFADAIGTMRFSANLETVLMERPKASRLLIIAPHPDDEMIGPGGTLLKALDAGSHCKVLYLTRPSGDMGDLRIAETHSVAQHAGYQTAFLDFAEDDIDAALAGKHLADSIEDFCPGIVMLPFFADDHSDHRMASEVLMAAADLLPEKVRPEIWAYQVYSALLSNVIVDITGVADRKAACIRMWRESAMGSRDWSHYALGLNAFNTRFLPEAQLPSYAELFLVLPLLDYIELCGHYVPAGYGSAVQHDAKTGD